MGRPQGRQCSANGRNVSCGMGNNDGILVEEMEPNHGCDSKVWLAISPSPSAIAAARLELLIEPCPRTRADTDSNRRLCAVAGSVGGWSLLAIFSAFASGNAVH